jgi:hypothetical protein
MMPEAPHAAVQIAPEAPMMPPPAVPQDDLDVPAFLRKRNDIM